MKFDFEIWNLFEIGCLQFGICAVSCILISGTLYPDFFILFYTHALKIFIYLGTIMVDGGRVGHDHIQLAGVKGQVSENFQPRLHVIQAIPLDTGQQAVFLDLRSKAVGFQNLPDEMNPFDSPLVIGGAPLELQADIVFTVPVR